MDKGYEDLYIAIWQMALQDEVKKAVDAINGYAFWHSHDEYCKNRRNMLEPPVENKKETEKAKRDIHKKAKSLCAEKLERRIKEMVMQETRDWPNNCYLVDKDPEYKKILEELKKEALAYAIERFDRILGGD